MGDAGQELRYLSVDDIIAINRRVIQGAGGLSTAAGTPLSPNSLHSLVESVEASMYGIELYPTLAQKASIYAYNIITGHIFADGNKRTGMISAFLFLRRNGCVLSDSLSDSDIVRLALDIACGKVTKDQAAERFRGWIL